MAEGAFSQFELDYGPADALAAADRLVFLRVVLKEIAKRHGLFVTYMAKPSDGDWRNGAHINHSVRRSTARTRTCSPARATTGPKRPSTPLEG